ncbi:MAG: tyrosine-type recombinase/integrase [Selenomonas sp.]|jgi:site-specific recombinase XerD|nr:tyrosine-type recombinase/integrase [Selenomonas sp.]MCI7331765.1 tyrosine-type recombinase/integrase [Selenomonadaceae bacterium]MDD6118927.1 tyrosine-type recombinase/integrase [Selenomonadaceae bacterium]MDD7057288.1 tyrosine-type recombinase/integrase [Selenomonadaceae bacterium]MDY3916867.1 tyrosine-type recombinase/integrase [Selenomonadaceae bacterium]
MSQEIVPRQAGQSLAPALDASAVSPDYFVQHYMDFLPRYIANGSPSAETLKTYQVRINEFIAWCRAQQQHPLTIQDYGLRVYRGYLLEQQYSNDSVHGNIIAVRAFFNVAVKMGLVASNPCTDISTPPVYYNEKPAPFYTTEQIQQLCDVFADEPSAFIRNRNLLIIYLMAVEGMRTIEVHRACVEDVNLDVGVLMVRGKGARDRQEPIYFCDGTAQLLHAYLQAIQTECSDRVIQKDGMLTPLILSDSHRNELGRISKNGLRYIVNKALRATKLKRPGQTCHILRHSCGTNLYGATKDLRAVQEVLRHKDPKITARYAHVTNRMENRLTSTLDIRKRSQD